MMEWLGIVYVLVLVLIVVVGTAVAAAVMACVAVSAITWVSLRALCSAEHLLVPVESTEFPLRSEHTSRVGPWVEQMGFRPVGSYRFLRAEFVAAWQRPDEPTYFCVYVLMNGACSKDFVTILDGDRGLTTADTRDGLLLPTRPGVYRQVFPGIDVQELWKRHLEALGFLRLSLGVRIRSQYSSFQEAFDTSIREQAKHVMSLPLWRLRAPYWYFVRRRRMSNRSVAEQVSL